MISVLVMKFLVAIPSCIFHKCSLPVCFAYIYIDIYGCICESFVVVFAELLSVKLIFFQTNIMIHMKCLYSHFIQILKPNIHLQTFLANICE
jgi:hypothetical protein